MPTAPECQILQRTWKEFATATYPKGLDPKMGPNLYQAYVAGAFTALAALQEIGRLNPATEGEQKALVEGLYQECETLAKLCAPGLPVWPHQ